MNTAQRTVWNDLVNATRSQFSAHMQGVDWSMNSTLSMVHRRWMVLVASIVLCVGIAIALLFVIQPQYTAQALMQINTRSEQVTKMQDVVSSLASTEAAIRTEVDVLNSRKLAARVVKRLGLQDELAYQTSFFGYMKMAIKMAIMPVSEQNTEEQENAEDKRVSSAVNVFLKNLNVTQTPRSYSIKLSYESPDREMSAKVLNTLMDEYLNNQLEERFEATRRASGWVDERLSQMQKQLQAADLAVQKFREANNLTSAKGVLLSEQQLSELNSQLILARTELAETQAKSNQARRLQQSGRGIESAAEVLNNTLISSLRQQETEVRREMADLASRYGDKHPRMITVRNQLGDLRRKISEEISKIQGSLENNVAVSQARVNTLQEQLTALENKTYLGNDASVRLAELERQAEASRTLYESFLARSKELAQMDFAQTDARIISAAEPPLGPSSPKKGLILAIAFVIGSALGVGLMFLLELLDSGFRTSNQMEQDLAAPLLGVLGELPAEDSQAGNLAHYVVNKPTSAFTEGLRAVRTAMQFAHPDKPAKVVLISSSIPEEGKSLFSISLAQLTAQGSSRVLLVDADMRRPSVSNQLGLKPKAGLAELLVGQVKMKDVIHTLPETKLDVIPSLPNSQFSQELLGSQKMRDLLADWRKTYDMIVIDSPPVMAVSDALTLSSLADSMLFMVRWGSTPRALAANAVKLLRSSHAPLTGTVMTRVDLNRQASYSNGDYGYYHGKYKGYYTE
ncbi:MAG: polysaccharide biosynthesis tyrosine autokinase [Blastochloris viridis]|uniref:non-specific protein-tyrosine kinase n=1 Tax=Blastochloris viridis TaxID=1079 RepID=A0A6N4RDI3_BLAVI|nr:MAG: polysaccharide biosynthesis tyrosine autokinase [Blastochloris viridis]